MVSSTLALLLFFFLAWRPWPGGPDLEADGLGALAWGPWLGVPGLGAIARGPYPSLEALA